mgnify:FL=1
MPERLCAEIQEIASDVGEHENAAIVKLLELGLVFYQQLPASMRGKLWQRNQTFSQQQSFRGKIQLRAERLIENSKLDSFIIFRASAEKKRLLQLRAEHAKVSVSQFIRSKLLEEEQD